jgi:hypothetical protein
MNKLLLIGLGTIILNSWGVNQDYIDCMRDRNLVYSCMEARYRLDLQVKAGMITVNEAEDVMQKIYGPLHCKEKAIRYLACYQKYGSVFDWN